MKQLDFDVSPPVIIMSVWLTLALATFDLDPCDHWRDFNACQTVDETQNLVTLALRVDLGVINFHAHKFHNLVHKTLRDTNITSNF